MISHSSPKIYRSHDCLRILSGELLTSRGFASLISMAKQRCLLIIFQFNCWLFLALCLHCICCSSCRRVGAQLLGLSAVQGAECWLWETVSAAECSALPDILKGWYLFQTQICTKQVLFSWAQLPISPPRHMLRWCLGKGGVFHMELANYETDFISHLCKLALKLPEAQSSIKTAS